MMMALAVLGGAALGAGLALLTVAIVIWLVG